MVKCIYGILHHKTILRKMHEIHQKTNAVQKHGETSGRCMQMPEPF